MKTCFNCNTPCHNQSTHCHVCNAPFAHPQFNAPYIPKKRGVKWWGVLLIVFGGIFLSVITIITIGALISAPSTPTATQTEHGINTPASYRNVEITVLSVAESQGIEYDEPKSGMKFVIVELRIKNISENKKISYNPLNFDIVNSKGQICERAFTTFDYDTALHHGELMAGGEIIGTITYEQPIDDNQLTLIYHDYNSAPTRLKFKLY